MQIELFGQPKQTYELFDSMRYRVVLRADKTAEDAEKSNQHLIKSLCPHLQYRKASSGKTKVYRINK
jgi:hypothetical protein